MNKSIVLVLLLCVLSSGFLRGQELDLASFERIHPRNIGPAGMSGRVTAIDVVQRNPDHIYVGAAAGGIWHSPNAGQTWTPLFEDQATSSIGDLTIYQKNPSIMYVGTGEGNPRNSQNSGWGVYKTIDGGRSWQHLGLEQTRQIHRVIVHPDNPDVVWVGASGATWGDSEHRGIYKTTDGGKTWEKVLYVNPRTGCSELILHPSNPNKLIAAMWEHHRDAWFFESGGEGSGLYLSYDGGESWEQLSPEDGLPEGTLGRMGLAFAPSRPEVVYAYIESEDNGIFRSEDGGESWKRVSKSRDSNIGGRPFYYAELYVDTQNENRVYSIATEVTVSEDGGRTWQVFAEGNKVHTDHHAWWSDPHDPDYILLGNDGGLHITHDRGKKWGFAEQLPLAQFYHIRVDMEQPYKVYGGLQDNGSWVGPSQTWFKGGIRNMYWQRLSVGDGFDVVPDPKNSEYGYAMGQAGNLIRYHRPSGQLLSIKPVHPEGEYLRFNWNAGIAIDPHDEQTVYYGSQYLHKSEDQGQSWEIISPDLTTNDPEKQQFLQTGGLTYDVTGAEFHTTIISIAPSPVQEGVIWVGTDDGNVQLTQDGGQTWTNLIDNIKGVPANTWVPHIDPSNFEAGEAFVVFEDHRRNNWTPYVYRTRNFGKSWDRIVDEEDVPSFVYCFEQDPVVENLYFCGTDVGLHVSLDAGKTWHRWEHGFPTTPVSDLVVHPREHDLVIGTFGRSIWILDDIRPLRALAMEGKRLLKQSVHAFDAPDAVLAVEGESHGYRDGKVGDFLYEGENRPYGALITYYLHLEQDVKEKNLPLEEQVHLQVLNEAGSVVRNLYALPRSGMNRVNWELKRDAPRSPMVPKPSKPVAPGGGVEVPPGTYEVVLRYGEEEARTFVKVLPDPRLEVSAAQVEEKETLIQEFMGMYQALTTQADHMRTMEKRGKLVADKLKESPDEAVKAAMEAFREALDAQKHRMYGKQDVQGIYRDPHTVVSRLFTAYYALNHVLAPVNERQEILLEQLQASMDALDVHRREVAVAYDQLKTAVKTAGLSLLE